MGIKRGLRIRMAAFAAALAAVAIVGAAEELTAGITTPGTTDYPNGGMDFLGSVSYVPGAEGSCGVFDAESRSLLVGTDSVPGWVHKIARLDEGGSLAVVGDLLLEGSESHLGCAVFDPVGGFAYFGTKTTPGLVVKVALGAPGDPPMRVGAAVLEPWEGDLRCAVVDAAHGFAYFGTAGTPGHVVMVSLGEGDEPPVRVGSVALEAGEDDVTTAVIDPAGTFAMFGTRSGAVVKMMLGAGGALPVRAGATTLGYYEDDLRCAFFDPVGGFACFGASGGRSAVRVDPRAGTDAPQRLDATELPRGPFHLGGPVIATAIDAERRQAFFSAPARACIQFGPIWRPCDWVYEDAFVRMGIPDSGGPLEVVGKMDGSPRVYAVDPVDGAFFCQSDSSVALFSTNQLGAVRLSGAQLSASAALDAFRFYSHAASGNLRFSIHSDDPLGRLLWQSGVVPNRAENAEVSVAISDGTPSTLVLPPGLFWLGWQTDSEDAIGSYGPTGISFSFPQPFGPSHSAVPVPAAAPSGGWTQYVVGTQVADDPGMRVFLEGEEIADGTSVDFGIVEPGAEPPVRTFTLVCDGPTPLGISWLSANGAFELPWRRSAMLFPGESFDFDVSLRSTLSGGILGGSVTFRSNVPDQATFGIPVTATVDSPEIEMSNAAFEFGVAPIGGIFPTRGREVRNVGAEDLLVQETLVPPGFHLVKPLADVIPAGQSDYFEVAMDTSSAGDRSGTLEIRTNDFDEPTKAIGLHGEVGNLFSGIVGKYLPEDLLRFSHKMQLPMDGGALVDCDVLFAELDNNGTVYGLVRLRREGNNPRVDLPIRGRVRLEAHGSGMTMRSRLRAGVLARGRDENGRRVDLWIRGSRDVTIDGEGLSDLVQQIDFSPLSAGWRLRWQGRGRGMESGIFDVRPERTIGFQLLGGAFLPGKRGETDFWGNCRAWKDGVPQETLGTVHGTIGLAGSRPGSFSMQIEDLAIGCRISGAHGFSDVPPSLAALGDGAQATLVVFEGTGTRISWRAR